MIAQLIVSLCIVITGLEGGKFFFNTVKEGDQVVFATEDEAERTLWVQAVYRATGQSHKPVPPASQQATPNKSSNTQLSRLEGGEGTVGNKSGAFSQIRTAPVTTGITSLMLATISVFFIRCWQLFINL